MVSRIFHYTMAAGIMVRNLGKVWEKHSNIRVNQQSQRDNELFVMDFLETKKNWTGQFHVFIKKDMVGLIKCKPAQNNSS